MTWFVVFEGDVEEAPVLDGEDGSPENAARWGKEVFGLPPDSYGYDWIIVDAEDSHEALAWASNWDKGNVSLEYQLFGSLVRSLSSAGAEEEEMDSAER